MPLQKKHNLNQSENADKDLKIHYTREKLSTFKVLDIPSGYSRHLQANERHEKYRNGFWLKEKVFDDILKALSDEEKIQACSYYYRNETDSLCKYLDSRF